jgi:hypothetical protein
MARFYKAVDSSKWSEWLLLAISAAMLTSYVIKENFVGIVITLIVIPLSHLLVKAVSRSNSPDKALICSEAGFILEELGEAPIPWETFSVARLEKYSLGRFSQLYLVLEIRDGYSLPPSHARLSRLSWHAKRKLGGNVAAICLTPYAASPMEILATIQSHLERSFRDAPSHLPST